MSIYREEGLWASCVGVKEQLKLTRTDSLNKRGFDMYVVTFLIWLIHQKVETCLGSGAQRWNRTTDTRIFSPLLYRLSYLGNEGVAIVYN